MLSGQRSKIRSRSDRGLNSRRRGSSLTSKLLSYGRSPLVGKVTYMNTKTSRFLAALLDNHTIKGFQCAAGDFLGAQTSIAGHIRAIRPLLLVGRGRPAVNVERAPTGIDPPPVRPKAKRLPSTGPATHGLPVASSPLTAESAPWGSCAPLAARPSCPRVSCPACVVPLVRRASPAPGLSALCLLPRAVHLRV